MLSFARTPRRPFEYADISSRPGAFRLVKLLPPLRGLFRDTIRIELITADHVGAVAYDTLSYTWGVKGSDPPDRTILIETPRGPRELRIYRPLEGALRNMAAGRPIFVDQICINQADDAEKASQVRLMHDIYSRCARLKVWLGSGTRASDSYFDCVRRICQESTLTRISLPGKGTFMQVFDAVMDPDIPVAGSVLEERDDVLALLAKYSDAFPLHGAVDVLGRPWFTRLWVIQEICLAPEVLFQCGSRNLCFDCFRMGMLFYTIYNTYWATNVQGSISQRSAKMRDYIFTLNQSPIRMVQERRSIHGQGTRQALYDLVVKYNAGPGASMIGSTLPEDRIYGLMGMADPQSLAGLRVNYHDTRKAYMEAAGILARQNLDVLLYSQFPKRLSGLPSWVPDWSMNLSLSRGYLELKSPIHSAGGEMRSPPTVDSETGRLVTRGIVVDTVVQIGQRHMVKDQDPLVIDQIDYISMRKFFDELDEFLARSRVVDGCEMAAIRLGDFGLSGPMFAELYGDAATEYLKKIHKDVAVWGQRLIQTRKTIQSYHMSRIVGTVGILPWYWIPASPVDYFQLWAREPLKAFQKWTKAMGMFIYDLIALSRASATVYLLSEFLRLRRRFSGLRFRTPNREEILKRAGMDPSIDDKQQMGHYSTCLLRNIDQKLYLTENGYIGTGPFDMELGDVVVVLFGLTVPVLLRKGEDSNGKENWSYVGEVYCEGIMNGETLDQEETSFTLV